MKEKIKINSKNKTIELLSDVSVKELSDFIYYNIPIDEPEPYHIVATKFVNVKKTKPRYSVEGIIKKATIPPMFQGEAFIDSLIGYIKYRDDMKKRMVVQTVNLMLNKLEKISGGNINVAINIINRTIEKGWIGIFPLNQKEIEYEEELMSALPKTESETENNPKTWLKQNKNSKFIY